MGTPNATTIVNDLVTQLGTISVDNGYNTDVAEVTRTVKTWDEATTRPSIGVGKGRVQYEHGHGGYLRCSMMVTIVGHVLGSTEAARLTALENMLDDIVAALFADHTRSGSAVKTTLIFSDDDNGVAHSVPHYGAGSSLQIELRVTWDRTTGAS